MLVLWYLYFVSCTAKPSDTERRRPLLAILKTQHILETRVQINAGFSFFGTRVVPSRLGEACNSNSKVLRALSRSQTAVLPLRGSQHSPGQWRGNSDSKALHALSRSQTAVLPCEVLKTHNGRAIQTAKCCMHYPAHKQLCYPCEVPNTHHDNGSAIQTAKHCVHCLLTNSCAPLQGSQHSLGQWQCNSNSKVLRALSRSQTAVLPLEVPNTH